MKFVTNICSPPRQVIKALMISGGGWVMIMWEMSHSVTLHGAKINTNYVKCSLK